MDTDRVFDRPDFFGFLGSMASTRASAHVEVMTHVGDTVLLRFSEGLLVGASAEGRSPREALECLAQGESYAMTVSKAVFVNEPCVLCEISFSVWVITEGECLPRTVPEPSRACSPRGPARAPSVPAGFFARARSYVFG